MYIVFFKKIIVPDDGDPEYLGIWDPTFTI